MPTFTVVSNTQSGNFQSDGVYMTKLPVASAAQSGPPTNQVVVIGSGSWGKRNTPLFFSDEKSGGAAIGIRTDLVKSALREALSGMPECTQFMAILVDDGTSTLATMTLMDTATPTPAALINGTAVCPGTDANSASIVATLQSGTLTNAPVLSITRFWIDGSAQTWNNIVGYSAANGPFVAATFQTNALAALNGTASGQVPDPYFVYTAGSSATTPQVGVAFAASGGTNGDSGVTDTTLVGTVTGSTLKGMQAATGLIWGSQLVLADFTTAALFAAVAQFANVEGADGWSTFASGTDYITAIANKTSNTMSDDNMNVIMDWAYVFDKYQKAQILVSPLGKAAGIVASLDPFAYPGNKPQDGAEGISSTERLAKGAIGISERGQRESNNINWLDYDNGKWVLAHGLTSAGRQINEIRAQKYIMYRAGQIAKLYQGGDVESTVPFAQADENDARKQLYTALLGLQTELQGKVSSMGIILNDSNNSPASLAAGFLNFELDVTTRAGVQYIIGATKVGNAVKVTAPPLPLAA